MIAVTYYSTPMLFPAWWYTVGLLGTFVGLSSAFPEFCPGRLRTFVTIVLIVMSLVAVGMAHTRGADFYMGDGCRYVSGVLYYLAGCWL
jgi:hypothetical protein